MSDSGEFIYFAPVSFASSSDPAFEGRTRPAKATTLPFGEKIGKINLPGSLSYNFPSEFLPIKPS